MLVVVLRDKFSTANFYFLLFLFTFASTHKRKYKHKQNTKTDTVANSQQMAAIGRSVQHHCFCFFEKRRYCKWFGYCLPENKGDIRR